METYRLYRDQLVSMMKEFDLADVLREQKPNRRAIPTNQKRLKSVHASISF